MKTITRICLMVVTMLYFSAAQSQTARIQIIHNCADAAASTVDVYVNEVLYLDNLAFRTATPFVTVPADVALEIDVAPGNSSSSTSSIYTISPTFAAGQTYVIVANGIVSASGYSPAPAFELSVFPQGRETATVGTNTDVLVAHGSTDAPTVDVNEISIPAGTLVNDLTYPGFTPAYLEVATGDYILNVTDATGATVVATYVAPLETLGLQGQALTVVASGFLNPANNSNGPGFGLYVALASGGDLIPLPLLELARVQVIHNCADAAAAVVDVYANGILILDNFAFRTATPYVDLPAGVELSIDVAPGNSTSSADSIYNLTTTLTPDEKYILVANGIVSATGYNPAQPFALSVFAGARETAGVATNTDVLVNHGATDAPTVDVVETSIPAGTIVNDISFPSFNSGYLELGTADYVLDVTDASGTTVVASYLAPLQTLGLQGQSLTVVASGFLDPSQNNNGAAFGLWVALAAGGDLIALPEAPLAIQEFNAAGIAIYPNPASSVLNIVLPDNYNDIAATINDTSGRQVLEFTDLRSKQIATDALSDGLYFLNLKNGDNTVSKKFIIAR